MGCSFRNGLIPRVPSQAPSNLHVRDRVRIQKSPILRRFLLRHRRRSVGSSETVYPAVLPSQAPSNLHVKVGFRIRKPPILSARGPNRRPQARESLGQRNVTSITLATNGIELAGNQHIQWIPDSMWTVYSYNGNSTVANKDAEVEYFTN